MRPGRLPIAPFLAAAGLFVGAAAGLQAMRDRAFGTDTPAEQVLYVQSPEVARRLALSYDAIAADVYWIRALQHFGGQRKATTQSKNYELLFPLLDMSTGLDPYFNIAYRFGAIFLSEPKPGGPGRPDLAIKLLEKGIAASPNKWQYYQDAGFVHFWGMHDYPGAAAWFERGSKLPGSAWFLKSLAAVTMAQGGQRESSRLLFKAILESSDNDWMRKDARHRLEQLDAMDAIDSLRKVVATYRERGGPTPVTWQALVRAGYLRAIPTDSAGVVFSLGPWSGDVSLGEGSSLAPLPDTPVAPPPVPTR